jgi:hypothetical protein
MEEKKIYCGECKFYEHWIENNYTDVGIVSGKKFKHSYDIEKDKCNAKIEDYRGMDKGHGVPRFLNMLNNCPYFKKGTPKDGGKKRIELAGAE